MANLARSVYLWIYGINKDAKIAVDETEAWADEIDARNPTLRIGANVAELEKAAADVESMLAAISEARANPQVGMDEAEFLAQLESAKAGLDALSAQIANPEISVRGLAATIAEIQAIKEDLQALGGVIVNPKARLDVADAMASADALDAYLKGVAEKPITFWAKLDSGTIIPQVDATLASLKKDIQVGLVINDLAAVTAQMETLRALMEKPADLNLELEPGIIAELAAIEVAIDTIKASAKSIGFDVNLAPAVTQFNDLKVAVSEAFMGMAAGASEAEKSNSFLTTSMDAVALAAAHLGGGFTTAEDGTRTLTGMVTAGGGAWGIFGGKIRLFGGALDGVLPGFLKTASYIHVIADAIIEFGAVAIPAAIAFSAFAVTAGQGVLAIYTRMAAMENVTGALGIKVGILNEGFLKLQNAVQPGVFELFGDALEIINSKTGIFQRLVLGTETVVEDLAARITNAVTAAGGLGNILAGHAVPDLQAFGNMVGNVFGIFGNLLKSMPGIAEVILHVMEGLTGFAENLTGSTEPILKFIIAIHGIILWGGLAASAIMWLGSKFLLLYSPIIKAVQGLITWGSEALAASDATGILAKSMVLLEAVSWVAWAAIAVVAIGAVAYEALQASGNVKSFIANLNAGLANDTASQAIVAITTDIGKLNNQLKTVSAASELQGMSLWQKTADQFGFSVKSFSGELSDLAHGNIFGAIKEGMAGLSSLWNASGAASYQAAKDTEAYKGAIVNLTGEQKNLLTMVGDLMKGTTTTTANVGKSMDALVHSYHDVGEATKTTTTGAYNYAQALEIMNLAGVKSGDSLSTMETKIKGLITGYKAMGVSAGIAGNAVNAETFAADQASSGISKLQQSMSTFLSTVTGGESTFLTFVTGIAPATSGLNKVSVAAQAGKASMNGLNAASLTLRQNFTEAITSAESVYQALQLQTQASGGTAAATKELGNAGKDLVGTLLNQSKGSAAAQAQLFALAQTVGYTGTNSFAALSKWVGNTKDSEKDLNKETGLLTISSANLAKDVTNLAGALGTTLTNAMATAVFQAEGGQGSFNKFADAIKGVDGQSGKLTPDAHALADQLLSVMGNSKEAENEFITLAGKMGMSQTAATNLWNSVVQLGDGMAGTHGDRAQFRNDVQLIIDATPGAAHDVNNLTSAIQKHGTTSSQYHNARQQLIDDMERAGINAQTAGRLVDGLTKSVQHLPKNTNVNVTEHATGTFGVSMTSSSNPYPGGISGRAAKGWKIPGYGGGDSVHIMAEPGEAIVPKHLVPQIAPLMKEHGIPGFAGGGWIPEKKWEKEHPFKNNWVPEKKWEKEHPWKNTWVPEKKWEKEHPFKPFTSTVTPAAFGSAGHSQGRGGYNPLSGMPGFASGGLIMDDSTNTTNLGPWTTSEYQKSINIMTKDLENSLTQYQTSLNAGRYTGKYGAGVSQWGNDVMKALKMLGLSPGLAFAVLYQMQTESGGNPNAINLSDSNAAAGDPSRGLMQVIGCVPLTTEILTKRGWLNHNQVQEGDETIGYNPATGRSEWTPVRRVVHYDDAEVWRIGSKQWHADVTPDHRWWSDTMTRVQLAFKTCPECGWKPRGRKMPARGVQVHRTKIHGITNPRGPRDCLRGEFVRTSEMHSDHRLRLAAVADTRGLPGLSLEDVRVIAWLQGDGSIYPVLAKPEVCPECGWLPGMERRNPNPVQRSNSVAVHRAKKHGITKDRTHGELSGYDGRIWQSKSTMVVKIRALLARIEHTESMRQRGKVKDGSRDLLQEHSFNLRRGYVTDLMKRSELMETGPEAFVLALSPDQRSAWLDSMIDAEGNRQQGEIPGRSEFVRVTQVDGPLQEAFKLAVYLEGYRPTYSRLQRIEPQHQSAGHIGMAQTHVAPSMFRPHEVLERQPVWCVETALGTWTMRQNGLPCLTGNSTFEAYAGPFGGDSIYNPMANIYAALNYAMHRYGRSLMSGGMGIGSGHGYADGGVINEPVFGLGLHSGQNYSFGEKGREVVTPVGRTQGGRGDTHIYNISVNGDSDPDGAARRIHQTLRDYKRRKGGQSLGIG